MRHNKVVDLNEYRERKLRKQERQGTWDYRAKELYFKKNGGRQKFRLFTIYITILLLTVLVFGSLYGMYIALVVNG